VEKIINTATRRGHARQVAGQVANAYV
jgi:hypothetical protein